MNNLDLYKRPVNIGRRLHSAAQLTTEQSEHAWFTTSGHMTPHELMTSLLPYDFVDGHSRQKSAVFLSLIISELMGDEDYVNGTVALASCRAILKTNNIGPAPHEDDWIEDERIGLTNRNVYLKWIKGFMKVVSSFSSTQSPDRERIFQSEEIVADNGTKAYFGEPCGDDKHYWFSETPDEIKSTLEERFGVPVEISDIKLIVPLPAPEDWKELISPARLFVSSEEKSTPYPFPVILKGSQLTGKVGQMFPREFCRMSLMEYKGTYVRVYSWHHGPPNKAASSFFGRDFLGPLVLVVPI